MKTGQKWKTAFFTLALITLSAPALAQNSGYGGGYSGLIAPTKQQQQNPQMQQRDVYPGVAVLGNSSDRPKGGLYGNVETNVSGAYNRYAGESEMERKRREAYERIQEQQEKRQKLQAKIRAQRLAEQRARMKEQAEAYARAQAEAQRKIAEEQRKRDQASAGQ